MNAMLTPERSPKSYVLKADLRRKEVDIQNNMMEIGEILSLGRGYVVETDTHATGKVTTGLGLCHLTQTIASSGLEKRYPHLEISRVNGEVLSFGSSTRRSRIDYYFTHEWNRLQFVNEEPLFLDLTYSQVNPLLNRIVLDLDSNRRFYYPKVKSIQELERRDLLDCLIYYAETSGQLTGREITTSQFGEISRIALRTEMLIAA